MARALHSSATPNEIIGKETSKFQGPDRVRAVPKKRRRVTGPALHGGVVGRRSCAACGQCKQAGQDYADNVDVEINEIVKDKA